MGTEGIQDKYVNPYTDRIRVFDRLFEATEITKFTPKELGEC